MRGYFLLLVLIVCSAGAFSQRLSYTVSFPNIAHHEAEISLTISGNTLPNTVFRMSRSSPGRYATHEFAKNVYNVSVTDKNGKSLAFLQPEGGLFQVQGKNDIIHIRYTLYGNHADGTYADIDDAAVLLNMPATLMWVKGGENWPVDIHFDLPAGKSWTVATQLKPGPDAVSFSAPGLQYLMDSPVLIGELYWHKWKVANPDGKSYEFRLALNTGSAAFSDQEVLSSFSAALEKLVAEAQAVYKEVPAFDFGTYTFLASINPYVKGDGMEHRNSTMITIPARFNGSTQLLETFSHEFFHCWNVERIRPASLEPFNFEKSNISEALWFAEGFTQYYGDLIMRRAGFTNADFYTFALAGLVNTKSNSPAAKLYAPVDMSRKAIYTDAGVSIDRNNYPNTFTSYYPYGAAVALALDLEMRTKFKRPLDELMQACWLLYGKTGSSYTMADIQQTLAGITNKAFADSFFTKYVFGHEPYDYNDALQQFGYQLALVKPQSTWIGNTDLKETSQGLLVNSNTVRGTPLYQAGADYGDLLISINDTPLKAASAVSGLLEKAGANESVSLVFEHRGQRKTARLLPAVDPGIKLVSFETAGLPVTAQVQQNRASWQQSRRN